MRLSDFSTDEAADIICDIIPHAKAITADADIIDKLKEMAELGKDKGKTKAQIIVAALDGVWDFVPILLKNHRENLFSILAIINQLTVEDIANQKLPVTLKQIKEAVKDPELMQLFT